MIKAITSTQNELSIDTAPPLRSGLIRRCLRSVRESASVRLLPIMQRAAHAYVGGEKLDDAMIVARRFAADGMPAILSYWNHIDASAERVLREYLDAIDRLTLCKADAYLAIKPPALRYNRVLGLELAVRARERGIRIHCDSHGPEVVDATYAMIEAMLQRLPGEQLSTSIPGRWSRSLKDADWAVERGILVRVVKGEWPDTEDPRRDPTAGFLEVIDRLAGRAAHVAVATHKVPLAAEAISRLRAAGTSCELELLFGLPMERSLEWARAHDVPVRIYVPYGPNYIRHAINHLRREPGLVWLVIKGMLRSASGGRTAGRKKSTRFRQL